MIMMDRRSGSNSGHLGRRSEAKLERMHQAHLTAMSPRTRAAYDRAATPSPSLERERSNHAAKA